MPTKVYELQVSANIERVWQFHSSAKSLKLLTPPGSHIRFLQDDLEVREGALHRFKIIRLGLPITWHARISNVREPYGFTDTAERSPFAKWQHKREFIKQGEGTLIRDNVEYELPFGLLGRIVDRLIVSRDIDKVFQHRHSVAARELQ